MKILIKEEQQERLKLAPFIYKAIASKRTSLGDNPAFPPYGNFGFEYDIVKKKYEEVDEIINNCIKNGELESKDPEYLLTVLSKKVEECKRLEEPIRPQLEKICENIINMEFSVPNDTVILNCKLVGKIKPKKGMRILPEGDDEDNGYDFEDVDEVNLTNKVILKRRFINSMIQGIAYWLSTDLDDWHDTVVELDKRIWGLWYEIKHITDYLLFTKEEKISEKNPMQMSYVEVTLGKNGKKTIIDAQGTIFPYLLRDTFRGFLELFSSHGLPEDNQKAMYIIRKADFLVAEPWDLRLGMGIMDMLHDNLTKKYQTSLLFKPNRIPYFFTELCELQTDEFNDVMQNFLLGTKKGNVIAREMDSRIAHDDEYQKFKDRIQKKNVQKSLISDGDFSKEELNDYVIQENETDEMMAYHGTGSDFDKFNHKKYLNTGAGSQSFGWGTYVTNDIAVANGYVEASKGNGERDFFLNLDPKPYLESLMKYDKEMIDDILEEYRHYVVATFRNSINKTYENVMNVINGLIEWKENDLNIYLPIDKVIKMYNEDPRFSNMSDDEKNKAIEDHKMRYEKKERPVKIFKACADILTHFKPEMDEFLKNRFAYLYEVDIPDDNGQNYLSWYDNVDNSIFDMVEEKLDFFATRYNLPKLRDRLNKVHRKYYDFKGLYHDIESRFDWYDIRGDKAASLLFMQCGFDGIKYPSGTKWHKPDGASEDAYNYVIFDANKVKIINKTKV